MALTAKTIRKQLGILKPIIDGFSLKTTRRMQNKIGELMEWKYRRKIIHKKHSFENFDGAWVIPNDERRDGVILYLHGGGYVYGDLEYAMGFGSALAVQCGTRVFCAAYRLAPEAPFPAAIEDSLSAYKYLLEKREELLEKIYTFENGKIDEEEYMIKPSPDVKYQMYLEYLGELSKLIAYKYREEYVWNK
jgi:hypothetical protein